MNVFSLSIYIFRIITRCKSVKHADEYLNFPNRAKGKRLSISTAVQMSTFPDQRESNAGACRQSRLEVLNVLENSSLRIQLQVTLLFVFYFSF